MFNLSDGISLFGIVSALLVSSFGAVWSLSWWLQGQFNSVKSLFYTQIALTEKNLLDKIEYHERHDDQRFSDLTKDLWDIRVRNAGIDKAFRDKNQDG